MTTDPATEHDSFASCILHVHKVDISAAFRVNEGLVFCISHRGVCKSSCLQSLIRPTITCCCQQSRIRQLNIELNIFTM